MTVSSLINEERDNEGTIEGDLTVKMEKENVLVHLKGII